MRIYSDIAEARRTVLLRQPFDAVEISPRVQEGLDRVFGPGTTPAQAVDRMLADVRRDGDAAVRLYTSRIDGVELASVEVSRAEIAGAYKALAPELVDALKLSAAEIRRFHEKQARQTWVDFSSEGALGQIVRPLDRVGIYAPGGTAPLPSSLLMAVVPARVAGVREIVCCSPPQRGTGEVAPVVLVAADIAGVDRVFRIGGAQAIGAMAYGTASVPRVDKIAGPGNIFVILAKRAVYGTVGIEALPGPTETVVVADAGADPALCAADLLAQAEHDTIASAILLTDSPELAGKVQAEVERQLARMERREIAAQSIANRSGIVVAPDLDSAIELANEYAPEHLCLLVEDPWKHVGKVRNAGGIFLGERSFEALGDYVAGPSHIMPTGGTARFASPVNVDDFRKVISLVAVNEAGLKRIGPAAKRIADAEGLGAHAEAVRLRLDGK